MRHKITLKPLSPKEVDKN